MFRKAFDSIADFGLALVVGMLPHSGAPRWFGLAFLGLVGVGVLAALYFSAIPLLLSYL